MMVAKQIPMDSNQTCRKLKQDLRRVLGYIADVEVGEDEHGPKYVIVLKRSPLQRQRMNFPESMDGVRVDWTVREPRVAFQI